MTGNQPYSPAATPAAPLAGRQDHGAATLVLIGLGTSFFLVLGGFALAFAVAVTP